LGEAQGTAIVTRKWFRSNTLPPKDLVSKQPLINLVPLIHLVVISNVNAHGIQIFSSTIPWVLIRLQLQTLCELVETAEQVNDCHQFSNTLII
jgi:hypothetical protein